MEGIEVFVLKRIYQRLSFPRKSDLKFTLFDIYSCNDESTKYYAVHHKISHCCMAHLGQLHQDKKLWFGLDTTPWKSKLSNEVGHFDVLCYDSHEVGYSDGSLWTTNFWEPLGFGTLSLKKALIFQQNWVAKTIHLFQLQANNDMKLTRELWSSSIHHTTDNTFFWHAKFFAFLL